MPSISTTGNRAYPSIPEITDESVTHTVALEAIKEALATHERRNRDFLNSFVRFGELVDLGIIDELGNFILEVTGGADAPNVVDGTVDGQVLVWDVGNNQYEPVNDAILRVNPAAPPTSPLGRFSTTGYGTTDVRKSFVHMNIGASVATVWSTDENGGTPSGFYSRSSMNFDLTHDWGFWNPGNQTGIPIFRITEDLEFILNRSLFLDEQADDQQHVTGRGQIWQRDDNTLMYTDETGAKFTIDVTAA